MFTKAALTDAVKSGTKICLPGATAKLEAQAGLLRYLSKGIKGDEEFRS